MDYLSLEFNNYQAQYEHAIIPVPIQETFSKLKNSFHHIAIVVDQWNQGPDLIVKVAQFGNGLFSLIPPFEPFLGAPKQFCKDAKIFTNLLKGFRCIDNLLHLTFAWKAMIMQASTLTIFAISIISFGERFALFDATPLKVMLAAIPIFGILPYGGLLVFSLGGLFGMMLLFALEKKKKLDFQESEMRNQNAAFWSEPLDLYKVDQKLEKHEKIVQGLTVEIGHYEAMIEAGGEIKADLISQNAKSYKLYACQKAIEELEEALGSKKKELSRYELKREAWKMLKKEWSIIDPASIERFRRAKEEKWASKLERLRYEKNSNLFSIASCVFSLSRQIFTMGAALSNLPALPFQANVTLDLVGASCDIINFIRKRALQNYKIPSVNITDYIPVNHPLPETQVQKHKDHRTGRLCNTSGISSKIKLKRTKQRNKQRRKRRK